MGDELDLQRIWLWTEGTCELPNCPWIEPKNHTHMPVGFGTSANGRHFS